MEHYSIEKEYIVDLRENFRRLEFERLKKQNDQYITNPLNVVSSYNMAISSERQVKRALRLLQSAVVNDKIKSKLYYFYQGEGLDCMNLASNTSRLLPEEKYSIQNVGHSTQLIQVPGFNVLTDPVFGDLHPLKRPEMTKSYTFESLPTIDFIVISHNHPDHVTKRSLKTMAQCYEARGWLQPKVFTPLGDKKMMEDFGFKKVHEVDWFTKISITYSNCINFVSIPADHNSGRSGVGLNKSLVCGWIINPLSENVIFKFTGDTKALSESDQQRVDAVIWNEIKHKICNIGQPDVKITIPDIVCLEPSGPNYTHGYMGIIYQSTSYSALLKIVECKNLSDFSGCHIEEFLRKMVTVMIHHNKYEIGVDRYNEGLFVVKKLIQYLDLSDNGLIKEMHKQRKKLEMGLDHKKLKENSCCCAMGLICMLPKTSSVVVHSKDFIINDMFRVKKRLGDEYNKELIKEYVIKNTVFPCVGQRLNDDQITSTGFNYVAVDKYHKTSSKKSGE